MTPAAAAASAVLWVGAVGRLEIRPGADRVHQVVDDVDSVHGSTEAGSVERVTLDDLHAVGPWHPGQPLGAPRHTAHVVPGLGFCTTPCISINESDIR